MKSRHLAVAAVVAAVILTISTAVMARGIGGGPLGDHGLKGLKTILELNLSDAQEEQVLAVIEKYRAAKEGTAENLMKARFELRRAMRAQDFDEQKVRAAHRALSAVKEELAVIKGQMRVELKSVLTPEQIALLAERSAQGKKLFKERMQLRKSLIDDSNAGSL